MISKEQLQAAQLKAAELDAATQELAKDLTELETLLKGLKLGVSGRTWLKAQSMEDPARHELGFEKLNGAWRLTYVVEGERCPLLSAPRSMRLLAVDALPRLVQALLASVQMEVTKVEKATEELDAFIDEVALHSANTKSMGVTGTLKCKHCEVTFTGTMADVGARHLAHLREAHPEEK